MGRTGRAAAVYVLLAGLQRGLSLLILPFVTHAMSPVEYGAASMLSVAPLVLTAVVAAPLIPLIVRTASRQDEDGPAILRAAGVYCYVVLPAVLTAVGGAIALLVPEILGVSGRLWGIELVAIGLQPAATTFALWVAQARADLRRFVWLSATSIVVMAVSKVVLVVFLRMGVLGWVLSDLISAAVAAALAVLLIRLPRARPSKSTLRYLVAFTLPLIPHSAALWALNSLSRPAMAAVSTFEQVGLLSFALNLAGVAVLVLTESNRAALPHYSRESLPAPTGETLGTVRWQLSAAFLVPAGVGSGLAIAGQWLFAEDYWPSFLLTGISLVGIAAYGLYLIPMNFLTQTAALPKYSAVASGAGAVVILVGILGFGSRFGAIGVVYVTAAGYLVMAAMALVLTFACRVDIAWRSWRSSWPEVVAAVSALALSVAALASPVGSHPAMLIATVGLTLCLAGAALTYRRIRGVAVAGR